LTEIGALEQNVATFDKECSLMMVPNLNLLAIIVAALVNMALGALWYSNLLFASTWTRLVGHDPGQEGNPGPGYAIAALASLLSALMLAIIIAALRGTSLVDGIVAGLAVGVGLVATAMATDYIFHSRPTGLFFINAGYRVVGLAIMGAILGVWQ
jgi:hypothetical protein